MQEVYKIIADRESDQNYAINQYVGTVANEDKEGSGCNCTYYNCPYSNELEVFNALIKPIDTNGVKQDTETQNIKQ